MSNELRTLDQSTIAKLVLNGDMKGLSDAQKVDYYSYRCQQAGLDPAAKPFDLLTLNGKMILYANASATQQLTSIHKLSHSITSRELTDGIYCVFCRVIGSDNRSTENMGAVPIEGLKGEAKANAMLKATTKAIRRTVLAHMGLGMMDETEVLTIPGAKVEPALTLAQPTEGGTAAGSPVDSTESLAAMEAHADLQDRMYAAFQMAGQMEKHPAEAEKWRKRFNANPTGEVVDAMSAYVAKLEAAAEAKKARMAA